MAGPRGSPPFRHGRPPRIAPLVMAGPRAGHPGMAGRGAMLVKPCHDDGGVRLSPSWPAPGGSPPSRHGRPPSRPSRNCRDEARCCPTAFWMAGSSPAMTTVGFAPSRHGRPPSRPSRNGGEEPVLQSSSTIRPPAWMAGSSPAMTTVGFAPPSWPAPEPAIQNRGEEARCCPLHSGWQGQALP